MGVPGSQPTRCGSPPRRGGREPGQCGAEPRPPGRQPNQSGAEPAGCGWQPHSGGKKPDKRGLNRIYPVRNRIYPVGNRNRLKIGRFSGFRRLGGGRGGRLLFARAGGEAGFDGVQVIVIGPGAVGGFGKGVNVEGFAVKITVQGAEGVAGVRVQAGDEGGGLLEGREQGGVLVELGGVEGAGQSFGMLGDEVDGGLHDALAGFGDVLELFALGVVEVEQEREVGADGGDGGGDVGDGLRGERGADDVLGAHVCGVVLCVAGRHHFLDGAVPAGAGRVETQGFPIGQLHVPTKRSGHDVCCLFNRFIRGESKVRHSPSRGRATVLIWARKNCQREDAPAKVLICGEGKD